MKIVIALDGDLLVSEDQSQGMLGQMEAITGIADQLGELVKAGHNLVITHGNAPQVGYMLLRGEAARHIVHPLPLDICGADTQGATGYMLQKALRNWLDHQGLENEVLTLITQVVVGAPAPHGAPRTKGIGPFFERGRAQALNKNHGWELEMVPGQGYQRVVPCLTPKCILEANSIRYLFERGQVVVCSGGGGIPVRINELGNIVGVEAVVDKAYTAFLLGEELQADMIIFVSQWERIINTFDLDLNNGLLNFHFSDLDNLLERNTKIEDTMRHKLIASRNRIEENGRPVLIVPPDQLGKVPDRCKGIQLIAGKASVKS